MASLTTEKVEKEIMQEIKAISRRYKLTAAVTADICPGEIGIESQVLLTVMGRLGHKLGVSIPVSAYIFHEKKTHRQLTIKEAAIKLINVAENGK